MAVETPDLVAVPSWSQGTEPNLDRLFTSSDSLTYLELWNFEDSKQNIAHYGPVVGNGSEILARLGSDRYKAASEGLIVFFSEVATECSDKDPYLSRRVNPPFRAKKETFQAITEALSLPMMSHLQMYVDGATMFMDMGTSLSSSGNEVQTFIIQNSFTTTSQYSACLSYNPSTRVTGAFVHGLCESEIIALANKVFARQDSIALPMMLPLHLISFRVDSARRKVGDSHKEIIEIEHQTGIRTIWHPGKACCGGNRNKQPGQRRYDGVDFDEVTVNLTSMSSKLAYVEFVCGVHIPMLDSFDLINKRILQTYPENCRQRVEEAEHRLRTEGGLLISSLQATFSRVKYLSKRGQVQVQTIYSLIAQKDNALSMKDNAALKMISEDQKRVAIMATRDSAAMSVISMITAVFLPATFTAAFFSTTFFNFQIGSDATSIVSGWLWLYFVVTFILSLLIVAWWHVSYRRKRYKIDDAVGGLIDDMRSRGSDDHSHAKMA